MDKERSEGKSVILAGDLNMGEPKKEMGSWNSRNIHIPSFLKVIDVVLKDEVNAAEKYQLGTSFTPEVKEFYSKFNSSWPVIRLRLLSKQHVQICYKNAKGEMVPKWRVCVNAAFLKSSSSTGSSNGGGGGGGGESSLSSVSASTDSMGGDGGGGELEGNKILLGKPMWSETDALSSYGVDGMWVTEDGQLIHSQADLLRHQTSEASCGGGNVYEVMSPDSLSVEDIIEVCLCVCVVFVKCVTSTPPCVRK
jgi:hypothetical protein